MNRKIVFDLVRDLKGRGFKPREVKLIDQALDCAKGDDSACTGIIEQRLGPQGIALIKRFEGCASLRRDGLVEAYPDPASGAEPWTIGWGSTGRWEGGVIGPGTVWTVGQCNARFERDLERYAEEVALAIGGAETSQAQFDALVSFHYNTGAIARATLTRKHIAGDFESAAHEFARWNKAAGRVSKGLTRRRQAEAKLYSSG
ncbi:MAG: glycoside hydrolase [Erythrobacter sp. RIFCSPHIGHO2_12_FULL_63_10]|nr:MAG: glycoside hydrolase [Erythrobacter sp. RIFCSPHIGHO2_12_FULL_63_10]